MILPLDLVAVWLLGADELNMERFDKSFVIYQGSHGDRGAHAADVILPGAAWTEKSATYVNFEGRPQMSMRATFPPGEAREDWTIIRAFSGHLGKPLPFDNAMELRSKIYETAPWLANIGEIEKAPADGLRELANGEIRVRGEPFGQAVRDFYLTNAIARASLVMNEMSTLRHEMMARKELAREEG